MLDLTPRAGCPASVHVLESSDICTVPKLVLGRLGLQSRRFCTAIPPQISVGPYMHRNSRKDGRLCGVFISSDTTFPSSCGWDTDRAFKAGGLVCFCATKHPSIGNGPWQVEKLLPFPKDLNLA
jgi:hypothetical protein